SWSRAPAVDATTAVVSRRAGSVFWSIKASDSRRIVTIVEAPKPRMSTITMSSPILIASRERNIAERSALRGLRDRLRELVRLFRIERPEAREHLSRLREPAHLHVRLAEVLERLRVLRAESQRFLVGLHGFLELPPLPERVGARGQGLLEFVSDGASRQLRGVRGDEPLLSALPARDAGAQEAAPRPPERQQVRLRLRRVRCDGRWQDGQRRERVSHDDPSRVVARFPVAANSAPDQSRRSRVSAR